MRILGIGGFSHDSAACLMINGEIRFAAMEERFTRKKHQGGMPDKAVQWCLDEAGIGPEDVDHIGFYMDWKSRMWRRLLYRSRALVRSPRYSLAYILYEFAHNAEYLFGAYRLKGKNTRIHFLNHHQMHGASAFFGSPFEEAALLSIDYIGEFTSTWMGLGRENQIKTLQEIPFPQSLGVYYSALTDYLGFLRANDEYKVMGLASYGNPETYIEKFREIITLPSEEEYHIDLDYFQYHFLPGSRLGYVSEKFIREFGPPRKKSDPIEERHQDIAAAVQMRLEEVALHLCRHLYELSGKKKHLCIAGGVGLNCSMNGRLLAESPFEDIYVQPAAGDDGIAIGICYHIYHEMLGRARQIKTIVKPEAEQTHLEVQADSIEEKAAPLIEPVQEKPVGLKHVYLGPRFDNEEIEKALRISKLPIEKLEDTCKTTAGWIAKGAIVGWFQGPMEFGPRALGSRSILADPTRADMKDILNKWVKHREDFRPFAPSVCEENFHDYFLHPRVDAAKGAPSEYPFMLFIFPVREAMQGKIPAVTHVDGTARVQTVSERANPKYYRLIREFEKIQGVPVVLNTSFNIRGEPIVCTPKDALRCFFTTGIDVLVLGDYLVRKG